MQLKEKSNAKYKYKGVLIILPNKDTKKECNWRKGEGGNRYPIKIETFLPCRMRV